MRIVALKTIFSKKDSLAIKGIAIVMMLWHHCFLSGRFETFTISFYPFSQSQIVNMAAFFKICVSLFAFVSGYGLYLSYQKNTKETNIWIKTRLIKLLSGYWFIVILSWSICLIIDKRTISFYFGDKSTWLGVWNMAIEFLGLSNFTGQDSFNGSWWYISAAVVFVILTPIIYRCVHSLGNFCVVALCFIIPRLMGGYFGGTHWISFVLAFVFGMIFAKSNIFKLWEMWSLGPNNEVSKILKFLLLLFMSLLGYKLYYHLPTNLYWDIKYGVIPVLIIMFAKIYILPIPVIGNLLVFLGKHSANVWLIHTFIRYYYCEDFIYGMGHFGLIISVLLVLSLSLSIAIEFSKRLFRYEMLMQKLI